MTDDEIRALIDAAAPGPWTSDPDVVIQVEDGGGLVVAEVSGTHDRRFIEAARTLVPELLERAQAAEQRYEVGCRDRASLVRQVETFEERAKRAEVERDEAFKEAERWHEKWSTAMDEL